MIVTPPPAPVAAVDEPLTASVTVYLTDAEKDRLRSAAKAAGVSMSAYVRARLSAL